MVVYQLWIINKAGGLIYNREFHGGLEKVSSNDMLVLAGTFHGVHAITKQICPIIPPQGPPGTRPVRPSGLQVLETTKFRLQSMETLTGIKFLLFTEPNQPNTDTIMRRVYELYSDFVMKSPFYTVEMPIRVEKFDRALDGYVKVRS